MLEVNGPWQEPWFDLYESRACEGIVWGWSTRATKADVSPLLELPRMKVLHLGLRGPSDAQLQRLTELEALELWNTRTEPLDLRDLHHLVTVGIQRPGPVIVDGLDSLRTLWLSGLRADTVRAPSAPNLRLLRLEGAVGGPWVAELLNLDAVPNLEELWLDRLLPASLAPLTPLTKLKFLYIASYPRAAQDLFLDLSPLEQCQMLKHIDISGCRVQSFEPLRNLPGLKTLWGPREDQDDTFHAISEMLEHGHSRSDVR